MKLKSVETNFGNNTEKEPPKCSIKAKTIFYENFLVIFRKNCLHDYTYLSALEFSTR